MILVLTGIIRPTDTRTLEVQGHSLAEITDTLHAQTPAGWELTDMPVRMENGTTLLTATAIFARRDGQETIEAADMTALRAKVPDGYTLVNVRSS